MTAAADDPLDLRVDGGVAWITLQRPRARNALSRALQERLLEAVRRVGREPAIRVAVLTGAGPAFCAGLDLRELASGAQAIHGADGPSVPYLGELARCPKPVIAAVNGPAVAAGLELVLACDFALAATSATFADFHARLGNVPSGGSSALLPLRMGPARAKELLFTGGAIDAARAESWGLVNRVVADADLHSEATQVSEAIAQADPAVVPILKTLVDHGSAHGAGSAAALELELSRAHGDGARGFARQLDVVTAPTTDDSRE